MTKKKEVLRRISLEKECLNFNVDYVFYGFLISIASARPTYKKTELGNDEWELYLSESRYIKCRPLLRKWMGGVSAQTIRNKLKKELDKGKMIRYDKEKKEYTFPYDYNERYYIMSRDIIFYLCATSSSMVIQTYIYLASRFAWKKNYEFTVKEIKETLGYSTFSQNNFIEQSIKAGLVALQTQGFIEFEIKRCNDDVNNNYKVQKYILKNVVTSIMPEKLLIEIKKTLPVLKPRVTMKDIFGLEER